MPAVCAAAPWQGFKSVHGRLHAPLQAFVYAAFGPVQGLPGVRFGNAFTR